MVWEFIVDETRMDILNFYICEHGMMIFVHRLERWRERHRERERERERARERDLIHVLQSRVLKDYKKRMCSVC